MQGRIILEPPEVCFRFSTSPFLNPEAISGSLVDFFFHPIASFDDSGRTPVFVQPSKLEAKHVELPRCSQNMNAEWHVVLVLLTTLQS